MRLSLCFIPNEQPLAIGRMGENSSVVYEHRFILKARKRTEVSGKGRAVAVLIREDHGSTFLIACLKQVFGMH